MDNSNQSSFALLAGINQVSGSMSTDRSTEDIPVPFLPPEIVIKILCQLDLADLCVAISFADMFGNVFKANWTIFTNDFDMNAGYGFNPNSANLIKSFCTAAKSHWEYET
jgi:hypothetical protein